MKTLRLVLAFMFLICIGGLRAYADPIDIYVGGGSLTLTQTAGGQSLAFSGQTVSFTSAGIDSASGTPLTISGNFLFNSISSDGNGMFAPVSGATFKMGNTSSGILTGSIDSIEIIGATRGKNLTTFSLQLSFDNASFKGCSALSCTNSSALKQMAAASSGSAILEFSFQNSTASSLAQLLSLKGTNTSSASGEFVADSSVTPEPVSLALFGTGLVAFGFRICRSKKKE